MACDLVAAGPGRAGRRHEAEREGFEPSVGLLALHTLSRRAPSTTRSPLRGRTGPLACRSSRRYPAAQTAWQTRLTHVCHVWESRCTQATDIAMNVRAERGLFALLMLNVALQLFDGLATYHGMRFGFGEGNPILVEIMTVVGPAATLILTKLFACGCLLGVW